MDRNTDMFSNLPSSLLVIIASFLSFKEAARTCILSKQWLDIWREAANIDFDENFFVKLDESEENQKVQREVFINFARQFIENHSQQVIETLGLRCSKPGSFTVDMQNIVMFATSRNVRGLSLDFSDPAWREDEIMNHEAGFELPSHVYEHGQALESLKLFSCRFDASKFTNFSAITSLSLGWININIGSIVVILESCPLLESLRLKKPGLRLQNLVLDKCDFRDEWLFIEGPKFQFFKYSGKVGQFHLENQREMVEAELDFGMQSEFEELIIPSGDEPLGLQAPLNVRNLILKTALHSNEYWGIKFMLRSCPRLEMLTIDIGPARIFPDYEPPYPFDPEKFWSRNFQVELSVTTTLRVVNVKGFKGTRNELYVLRYLLHFGRAMEELNLYVSNEGGDNGENREFYMGRAQKVLGFYKASRNVCMSVL
ncbi:F-box protein [Salix suchowensis]|nr:F-box protein [Salix suchowensis]